MPDCRPAAPPELSPPPLRPPLVRLLRGHPSEGALERYYGRHAGGPAAAAPSALDGHIARCAECHDWLRWRAALGGAARDLAAASTPAASTPAGGRLDALATEPTELTEPTEPTGALAAALHRRAAGERVLLPPEGVPSVSGTSAHTRAAPPRLAWVTAAGAVFAALVLARPVPRAEAGRVDGELTITPRVPSRGDTLAVAYRPTAVLAGASRLRLRATFHPDDDTRPWARPAVTAAWLTPGADGAYRARVVLPPGTAYARFAVEDSTAHAVDAHGRQPWDVVLADAAGRPRVPGIRSQGIAAGPGAWERQRQLTLEATRLHPDHPSGWWARTGQDLSLVGSARADSVAVASRPLVARLDSATGGVARRGERVEPWAMLDLASFAAFAGRPEVERRWHARLLAEHPRSAAAYSRRMQGLWAARTPPAAQLDSLERWWAADGDSLAMFLGQTVGLATAAHDTAAARRWAARAVAADPVTSVFVAQQLVRGPGRDRALAALAVGYARADIERLASAPRPDRRPMDVALMGRHFAGAIIAGDPERPLDATAAAWGRERAQRARTALAVVGEGLLTLGHAHEAAAALAEATAAGWNADAFRLLGEARLATGDTTGALGAFAYAAADPRLGARLADSLGARLGARAQDTTWTRTVTDARRTMHARVLDATGIEVVRGDPRVGDAGGARRRLSALAGGRVTVVAMLGSRCGPALADLPAVAQLRAGLAGRPVTFVALTREAPGGTAERELRARGLTAPLWYDVDGEATAALDARGTPTYLVLDRAGQVRWRGHRIRDVSPVLDALVAQSTGH